MPRSIMFSAAHSQNLTVARGGGRVVAYDYSRSRVVAPPPRELVAGIVALQGRTSEHHADELQAAADQGFQQPFEAP